MDSIKGKVIAYSEAENKSHEELPFIRFPNIGYIGENVQTKDINDIISCGALTRKKGSVLRITNPIIQSLPHYSHSVIPGLETVWLQFVDRSIIIETKRAVAAIDFKQQEIIHFPKSMEKAKYEISSRCSAIGYVRTPNIVKTNFQNESSTNYFVEEFIRGEVFAKADYKNYVELIDKMFIDLFNMHHDKTREEVTKQKYCSQLVENIAASEIYLPDETNIDELLGRLINRIGDGTTKISITHGDLHSRNILRKKEDLFLIDWELSDNRSILYDLLNFCFNWLIFDDNSFFAERYIYETRVDSLLKESSSTIEFDKSLLYVAAIEKLYVLHTEYMEPTQGVRRIKKWENEFTRHLL